MRREQPAMTLTFKGCERSWQSKRGTASEHRHPYPWPSDFERHPATIETDPSKIRLTMLLG